MMFGRNTRNNEEKRRQITYFGRRGKIEKIITVKRSHYFDIFQRFYNKNMYNLKWHNFEPIKIMQGLNEMYQQSTLLKMPILDWQDCADNFFSCNIRPITISDIFPNTIFLPIFAYLKFYCFLASSFRLTWNKLSSFVVSNSDSIILIFFQVFSNILFQII